MISLRELNVTPEVTVLPNGLKIVNFRRKGAPVALKCLFHAGSRFDEIEGTAHFLEHMLVAGTKKFPNKDKLAIYIENYGGILSASTGAESLDINISISDPEDIKIASEIFNEILLQPLFNEKTIEAERSSILKELGEIKSNPRRMIKSIFRRLVYQKTSLGHSNLGTENTISLINKSTIIDFYDKNILSGEMVLVASGDTSIDEIKDLYGPILLTLKPIRKLSSKLLEKYYDQRIFVETYKGSDQVQLIYGFRTTEIFNKNNPALIIIAAVLADGRASTLIRKLRYDKGLVYGVEPIREAFSDCGSWAVRTSTAKKHVQEVTNIIKEEISRIANTGLTKAEISFAKNKIIKSKRLSLQTSASWVNFHAFRQIFCPETIWSLENYINEIQAVDQASIKQASRMYLDTNKSFLALCGDINIDEIKI